MTLREFIPMYYEVQNQLKPEYARKKAAMIENVILPRFGDTNMEALSSMSPFEVKAWIGQLRNQRKLTNRTINNYTTILRNILNVAREGGLIKNVPAIKAERPEESFTEYLKASQISAFIDAMPTPLFRALAIVGLNTGMRIGELTALQWDTIDFERNMITIKQTFSGRARKLGTPKGHRSREIPMNRDVVDALQKLDRTTKFVFCRPSLRGDRPLSYKALECAWKHPRRKLRLPWIGRHTMRHTFAAQLALAGASILHIQKLLGHVDIKTTMRYAHLRPSELQGTVDLLSTSRK